MLNFNVDIEDKAGPGRNREKLPKAGNFQINISTQWDMEDTPQQSNKFFAYQRWNHHHLSMCLHLSMSSKKRTSKKAIAMKISLEAIEKKRWNSSCCCCFCCCHILFSQISTPSAILNIPQLFEAKLVRSC